MFGKKDYIGIALDNKTMDSVRIQLDGKKVQLLDMTRHELVTPLDEGYDSSTQEGRHQADEGQDVDDIFGFDNSGGQAAAEESSGEEIEGLEELEEFDEFEDFDELDDLDEPAGESMDLDITDEADAPENNVMLLYNYLLASDGRKKHLGLNIRSGNTVFLFERERNFKEVKQKELQEVVSSRLESVYGFQPTTDRYSYFVRPDGSLSIASVDKEPASLELVNQIDENFSGLNLYIENILPDEVALTGLYRYNYPDADGTEITGLIQFGASRCRIIFMRGKEVLQVSPVINEGTLNKNFLNTLFSKLLFQLDTGEVPALNRIVLCDNTLGSKALEFFQNNFPDVEVSEFTLNPNLFEISDDQLPKVREYTTAIAIAVGASGAAGQLYPDLSIIPDYVHDRQKIFKLEWHGVILLIAIGLSPILVNHYYQENQERINQLESENQRVETMISDLEETVIQTELLQEMLVSYQDQLVMLQELSEGNIRWTASFDRFNDAVADVGGIWITSFRETADGLQIEGNSLFEDRIPQLARQFSNVTLLNVRNRQVQEQSVFSFTMRISRIYPDDSFYTPEETRELQQFLETMN